MRPYDMLHSLDVQSQRNASRKGGIVDVTVFPAPKTQYKYGNSFLLSLFLSSHCYTPNT